jgi:predicted ATPase/class 3 adenylate cyclase
MAELPTGTVTLVFTDIEGSSDLWARHGPALQRVLEGHRQLVREAAARWNGHEVETAGDSFFLAFGRATDAVRFAVSVQLALAALPGESPELPAAPRVRIGIHTGEPFVKCSGDDVAGYQGPPVNRAARVAAAGHGGQVVVTEVVRALVQGQLPSEIGLVALGSHRLRGVGEERLWQVTHPRLAREFPALRTLDAFPHNLPLQVTPFIGRERELAAVERLLQGSRLVTLTGPGGAGKTRLALQVAEAVIEAYADGVCFVSLAAVSETALVASAVAQALGVRETSARPVLEAVADHLRDRRLLLVLDNFEQVLAAAPAVAELLASCPRLSAVVTSRAPLRLRGEREYPVPPLELPDPDRLPSVERLSQYAAVQLFVERALAVQPSFAVTNDNAPAVAEICHRLDGLPLAIELAAARVKVLPPQALRARLTRRLDLLTGGARDLPARQRTLRATIAWSYDLLAPAERALFRRLAVFRGGCTLEAAEAVCDPGGDLQVAQVDPLEGVAALVDSSLLRADEHRGEPRFTMLETVREFAHECLLLGGELGRTQRRHAEYCAALAERAAPHVLATTQAEWLDRLDVEHDNLRAAITFALSAGAPEIALRIIEALRIYWLLCGHLAEAWERTTTALALLPAGTRPRERGPALAVGGLNAYFLGKGDAAAAMATEALPLCIAAGEPQFAAICLGVLGGLSYVGGDLQGAGALWEEGLALAEQTDDRWMRSILLSLVGIAAADRGEHERALDLCTRAVPLAEAVGEAWAINQSQYHLACVHVRLGQHREAEAHFREALSVSERVGFPIEASLNVSGLATVCVGRGELARAVRLFAAGEAIRRRLDAPVPMTDQAEFQKALDAARVRLDEATFAALWAEGFAMTAEQAIRCAEEGEA